MTLAARSIDNKRLRRRCQDRLDRTVIDAAIATLAAADAFDRPRPFVLALVDGGENEGGLLYQLTIGFRQVGGWRPLDNTLDEPTYVDRYVPNIRWRRNHLELCHRDDGHLLKIRLCGRHAHRLLFRIQEFALREVPAGR